MSDNPTNLGGQDAKPMDAADLDLATRTLADVLAMPYSTAREISRRIEARAVWAEHFAARLLAEVERCNRALMQYERNKRADEEYATGLLAELDALKAEKAARESTTIGQALSRAVDIEASLRSENERLKAEVVDVRTDLGATRDEWLIETQELRDSLRTKDEAAKLPELEKWCAKAFERIANDASTSRCDTAYSAIASLRHLIRAALKGETSNINDEYRATRSEWREGMDAHIEADRLRAHAQRQADDEVKPRGLWRCEGCGDAYDIETDPSAWLWTGEAFAHKCPGNHPQVGYMPARWFGEGEPAGPFGTASDGGSAEAPEGRRWGVKPSNCDCPDHVRDARLCKSHWWRVRDVAGNVFVACAIAAWLVTVASVIVTAVRYPWLLVLIPALLIAAWVERLADSRLCGVAERISAEDARHSEGG